MHSRIDKIVNYFGLANLVVINLTFILFTLALFVKGFTHDLLIEIAVFLVSVKLIIMTYHNHKVVKKFDIKLDEMDNKIDVLLDLVDQKDFKEKK